MLRPSTRRLRALLPWAVGPLLALTAVAWAASRPVIRVPIAAAGAVGLVPAPMLAYAASTPGFVISPAEIDPRFVVPKSAEIDPRIVVNKSAEIDPRVVAAAPGAWRGR